jgi:peptide/nickel transport system permease protein
VYQYAARRLAQALIVILAAVTVVFVLARLSGNPAQLLAPEGASPADIAAIAQRLGLNEPMYVQYLHFLSSVARFDFGQSSQFQAPVTSLIIKALPYTFVLGAVAFAFAAIAGLALGIVAAMTAGRWIDSATRYVALLGQSVPVFWLGVLLVLVFAVKLHWLPAFGSGSPEHLILPAIALGLRPLASIARLTRSATLEVLRAEHTRFERSKGVSQAVLITHIFRNVSIPVITLGGIQLGDLLAGSVVVETLFGWPGLGLLAIQAVSNRDYAVVQAVVMVATLIYVALNLAIDLSYGWLDPRIRRA